MPKIVILSKTKYLEEALNSSSFLRGRKIVTSLKPQSKVDLFIVDEGMFLDKEVDIQVPQIKISKSNGADVTKPFKLVNLINLIRTKLENKEAVIKFATLSFFKKKKQVRSKDGSDITLTMKEAQILEYLLKNMNRENTSEQILKDVWGVSRELQTRTIETHVYSLRKKLSQLTTLDLIQTGASGYFLKCF